MIYDTLYTVTILALAVGLIFSWRKQIKLKNTIMDLYSEVKDLEGYTRALDHVNRRNLETISHLYKSKNHN